MGDISVQQKIERQRQRRQRRILESAESRLEKIQKFQTASESLSPNELKNEKNTLADHYPAPTDPRRLKYESSASNYVPVNKKQEEIDVSPPESIKSSTSKYFDLLHFLSMVWLAILAMYKFVSSHGPSQVTLFFYTPHQNQYNWAHYPIFWYFLTLELVLYLGREFYQPDFYKQIPSATQLPTTLQKVITLLIYFYRDLSIVIFMVGFSSMCISSLY